jgi:signal transduction histidine kinase
MEFAVLRQVRGDGLQCLARWGDDDSDPRAWDLAPIEAYPPFQRAVDGQTVALNDIAATQMPALREERLPLRSLVIVPVRVGASIFGVLSLGARCPFDYSATELRAFESIANSVGIALANSRNSQELARRVGEYTEAAVAITGVEVARAARHEAVGLIDNCSLGLRAIRAALPAGARAADEVDAIETDLRQLSSVLDKIRAATRPPERFVERVDLHRVVLEARSAVAGRLQGAHVAVDIDGPQVALDASREWLRQVFLNLFLNSVDAFEGQRGGRSGRRISLTLSQRPGRVDEVEVLYRDNAGGINPKSLARNVAQADQPVHELVFAAGVSSKQESGGYGLWLARRIVAYHNGSIDLLQHRGGVAFRIILPTRREMAV